MVRSLPRHVRDLPLTPLGVGEVVVSDEPTIIHTTLGSCVSVTLHDPITRAGAMLRVSKSSSRAHIAVGALPTT